MRSRTVPEDLKHELGKTVRYSRLLDKHRIAVDKTAGAYYAYDTIQIADVGFGIGEQLQTGFAGGYVSLLSLNRHRT